MENIADRSPLASGNDRSLQKALAEGMMGRANGVHSFLKCADGIVNEGATHLLAAFVVQSLGWLIRNHGMR